MHVVVIINPIAGARSRAGTGHERARLASRILAGIDVSTEILLSERPGHAHELACQAVAAGASVVVAWGGDGTVNQIASALVDKNIPLAIVPAGSGNGLAGALGTRRRPAAALLTARWGTDRAIDVGELDGRLFFNVAGIGLDADVARRFNASTGHRRGVISYATISLRALLTYEPRDYRITVDEQISFTSRAALVALANGPEYGNRLRIAPEARLDDGALDLVVVEADSIASDLWRTARFLGGALQGSRGVRHQRARTLVIEADAPISFHVDGEPANGGSRLSARIRPRALLVRVPPTVAAPSYSTS